MNAAETLALLDKHTPDSALSKVGLSPAQVRALVCSPLPTPEETRRSLARAWRRSSHGGAAIPGYVVSAMHAEYLRLGSLSKAAKVFGRTKQDLAFIFHRRCLPVKSRGGPNRRQRYFGS